mmetsp:Transcript_10721/g.18931  ORF Transcript_10721/g.18931 Transcript_10721/m.18931 type:complete len:476 (-) Transcript_10721:158-1585(-)
MASAEEDPRSKYDLVSTIAPYLDLHMMLKLIEYLQGKDVFKKDDLAVVQLDLLRATYMMDYARDKLSSMDPAKVDPEEDAALLEKREHAVKELEDVEGFVAPLLDLLRSDNAETLQDLVAKGNFNLEYLAEEHGVTEEVVEAFFRFGKLKYETGNYLETIYIMLYFRELAPDSPNAFMALQGKLASELLMLDTTDDVVTALKDIQLVQKQLDDREENPDSPTHHLEQLQFRSWLLHWSLFLFFKSNIQEPGEGSDGAANSAEYPDAAGMPSYLLTQMMEFFFTRRHIDAVQTNCPWLLRYLVVVVVINRRSRKFRHKLITTIQQETYQYSDPLTRFVECLYIDFNFDLAMKTLQECEAVMKTDFFLEHLVSEFVENARLAIFETFCRIHTKIDTKMLSDKIDLGGEDAEQWLVNLIQGAKMDAKIDSEQGCVVMGSQQFPEVYQQIIDKTKDLAFRSYQLANECQALHQKADQQS